MLNLSFQNQVQSLILERESIDDNDPAVYKFWNKLSTFLAENEEDTIQFLNNCSPEDALTISEVFEDVSEKLQSQAYINCLENLGLKYPDLNLESSIKVAKDFFSGS